MSNGGKKEYQDVGNTLRRIICNSGIRDMPVVLL